MAGPGDPDEPTPAHDPDDLVGFASPAHLAGRPRAPEPEHRPDSAPESEVEEVSPSEPEPEFDLEPAIEPEPLPETPVSPEPERAGDSEPDLGVETPVAEPSVIEAPEPAPLIPSVIPAPRDERAARPDRKRPTSPPPAPMGLYAVYALILFAVPTLGASAVLALLAVTGRDAPRDPLAASHFIFQQRTLWAGAVVALLGAILIVINIGVFVLFVVALWLMARGVWGVLRLKSGQPIPNPRSWLF